MIKRINEYLSFIISGDEPLSSNAFFINGKNKTYIYDVGRNDEAYNAIQEIKNDKCIIISHFHGDHISNLDRITYSNLYVSNYTYKHTNKGNIVRENIHIDDEVSLDIIPASSVHAKGSLLLNINNEYCLIGDLTASDNVVNKSLAVMMINDLKKVDTKYFVLGHRENCIYEKDTFIMQLKGKMVN